MQGKGIEQIQAGDRAEMTRAFGDEDVALFAGLSGDRNPAHLDEGYAAATPFGSRIVHGMLVASLFSALLGTQLPGLGTIYTGQTLKFVRPVYLNDPVTASVTVRELKPEKNRVVFDCLAVNSGGEPVLVGEAVVMPPRGSGEMNGKEAGV